MLRVTGEKRGDREMEKKPRSYFVLSWSEPLKKYDNVTFLRLVLFFIHVINQNIYREFMADLIWWYKELACFYAVRNPFIFWYCYHALSWI